MAPFKQLYLTMQPFPGICGNICRRGDLPKERGELAEPFLPFLLFDCPARGGERSVHRMMEGLAYLREMNVASVLLRLTVAMLFGGFIGLERERKRRPAGFRTYMLVCLGAALTMLLSQYESYMVTHAWHETAMEIGLRTDVSRFGAQVINGIGFLGAGTIIVTGKQEVKGLTTAAGLWACACIGLAVGIGYVEAALLALLFVVLTFSALSMVDRWLHDNARVFDLYIELESHGAVKELLKKLNSWDCQYSDFTLTKGAAGSRDCAVTLTVTLGHMGRKATFIEAIQLLDFVSFCNEL